MPYRRSILFFLVAISVLSSSGQSKKPNFIFILADDLGYGDVGFNGQQKFATPNIDKLAVQGIRFTNFYSGSTVCAPARSTFMTGLHTGHTAIRGNRGVPPEGQVPMPDSVLTFPMVLQQNGYVTAAFGKWSMGFISSSGDPQKKGFDHFYGYNCQSLAHNYYPDHLWNNHTRIDLPGNLKYDSAYSADMIHAAAMQFLSEKQDKPFFLYLPYTLPHADVIAPHDEVYEYYVKKFNEPPMPAPRNNATAEKNHFDPYPHASFAAMVARLDKYVGEIMQRLKEKGLEENTWIFFTSDNGPHQENRGDPVFFNSNAGFRGIKRDLYEGGIREPFIAYKKGTTKPAVVNLPSVLYDMYPTFMELANIKLKRQMDGQSLVPVFMGKTRQPHPYLYWELHEAGGKQAIRMGNWKAVRNGVMANRHAAIELYDLDSDPAEKNNVAAQHPSVIKQMEKIFIEAYIPNPDWPLFPGEGGK